MNEPLILQGIGAAFVLGRDQTVGRSRECGLVLPDLTVSRVHARIAVEAGRVMVHDLKSQNGTFVNGVRVTSAEIPFEGTVTFGAYSMQLRRGSPEDPLEQFSDMSTNRIVRRDRPPTHLLSPAELRVLPALLDGLSEKEAAERLNLSPHTIHNHVRAIYQKLKVTSRPELLKRMLGDTAHGDVNPMDS